MDLWTEEQKLYLRDSFLRNNGSVVAVQREFTRHYNLQSNSPVPSSETILECSLRKALPSSEAILKPVSSDISCLSEIQLNNQTTCQICHSGHDTHNLWICDGCTNCYHTFCFTKINKGVPGSKWFCPLCSIKTKGDNTCIVCGKNGDINIIVCEHCPTALHIECIPQAKVPEGKWCCSNCSKKNTARRSKTQNSLSPCKFDDKTNSTENLNTVPSGRTGKINQPEKRFNKFPCRLILDELDTHPDAWPFHLPVNTKKFPLYKKIIKKPMDLQSLSRRLTYNKYNSTDDFVSDVHLMFDNCKMFNEDDSPVGKAGHALRAFFEKRWAELIGSLLQV